MSDEPRDGTIRAVEARVARLEIALERVELEQKHQREVWDLRFDSIKSDISGVGAKLDAFVAKIDLLIAEGQKQSLDLEASPLGRRVANELRALELGRIANHEAIEKIQLRLAVAAGVISTLAVLLSLFGPSIRHALGLGG